MAYNKKKHTKFCFWWFNYSTINCGLFDFVFIFFVGLFVIYISVNLRHLKFGKPSPSNSTLSCAVDYHLFSLEANCYCYKCVYFLVC